ncbi:MAG TPA: hypothetical protein VFX21_10665, partial [Acidimicrobiia bacterium]|nr:hypothetical protein [Acidimicrobiia bacterium]
SRLVHAELTRLGVRVQLVPTLVPRSAFDDWRTTRIRRATVDMIGWHVGDGGDRDRSELEPAAQALTTALRNHLELRIDLTGDPNRMPELLLHHRRVRVIVGPPSRSDVARWDLQLWTPDHVRCEIAGYLEPVVVAGAAGVPTAAGAASGAARDALLSAATTVPNTASANSWSRVIEHFLGDARQLRRESATVSRRVESLFGAAAASTVLNRFFGWATNGAEA